MGYCWTSDAHNIGMANYGGSRLNGCAIRFYTNLGGGADPHPSSALDPAKHIQLGEVFLSDPALTPAGSDSTGKITFDYISDDINCDNDGDVAFARIVNPVGEIVEWQLDAGTSGTSIILSSGVFTQGGTVKILSMTARHPNGM